MKRGLDEEEEEEVTDKKPRHSKTVKNVCLVFELSPSIMIWIDVFYVLIAKQNLNVLKAAEKYIPPNELYFFIKACKEHLSAEDYRTFFRNCDISFRRARNFYYRYTPELFPELIRLDFPVENIPSMGHLWLNWSTENHLKLPRRLCKEVKLLLWAVRHLPKDVRIRIVRTYVLQDFPFKDVGGSGDSGLIQTEREVARSAWVQKNYRFFGNFHSAEYVIMDFIDKGILEQKFEELKMYEGELNVYNFPTGKYQDLITAFKIKKGNLVLRYDSAWLNWSPGAHFVHFNDNFRRDVKCFLLYFRGLRQVKSVIIHWLACLYGIENYLCSEGPVHWNRTKREYMEQCRFLVNAKLIPAYRKRDDWENFFVKEFSFRKLLKI